MGDYSNDTRLAAVLPSGLDGARDTPPSSLPRFPEESSVCRTMAPLDAQGHTTAVSATKQAACTIEPADMLRLEHNGAQESPSTSLPVIRDKRPAFPTVALIDAQVHTTSMRATGQAACTTELPPTTLPARTEPAAPVTPPAPRASSKSSLSSAPNNTKSPSPQPRRAKSRRAG